jgi:hypothetical protein
MHEDRMEELGEQLRLAHAKHESQHSGHGDVAAHIGATPWSSLPEKRKGKWVAMAEAAHDFFEDHGYFDG